MREEFRRQYLSGGGAVLLLLLLLLHVTGLFLSPYGNGRAAAVYESYSKRAAHYEAEQIRNSAYRYEEKDAGNRVVKELADEVEEAKGYPAYRKQIKEQAGRMLLFFSSDSYAARNAKKTAADFEKKAIKEVSFYPTLGVTAAFHLTYDKLLLFVAALFLCAIAVTKEKELDTFPLMQATSVGPKRLVFRRLFAVLSGVSVYTIVTSLLTFLYFGGLYGGSALFYPVQYLLGFKGCLFSLSVLDYLLLHILFQWGCMMVLTLLLFALCLYTSNHILLFLEAAVFLAAETALFYFVPESSVFSPVKYLNFVTLLSPDQILGQYRNCNVFGHPVSYLLLSLLFLGFLLLLFLCIIYFGTHKMREHRVGLPFFRRRKKKKKVAALRLHSLTYWESYKHFYLKRTGLILLLFLVFSAVTYHPSGTYYKDVDEYYYKNYMKEWSGTLTEEKVNGIRTEYERFYQILSKIKHMDDGDSEMLSLYYSDQLTGQNAFYRVYDQYLRVKEKPKVLQMVYDSGYKWLLSEEAKRQTCLLFLEVLLATLLFSAGLFVEEETEGVRDLLHATKKGRSALPQVKWKIGAILYTLSFCVVFGLRILAIKQIYGYPDLFAPAASLTFLVSIPSGISILLLLILVHVSYYLMGAFYLAGCLLLSRRSHSLVTAMLYGIGLGAVFFGLFYLFA